MWVNRLTHTKKCKCATKNAQNSKISGVFWSCWADLNRRSHPYQIMTSYFLLLLLVVSCFPYSLRRSLSTIFFTVSCRSLLPPARCGFLVTVAVFVSASVCSLICYKKEKRDRCRHQSLERMHYHPFVLHCHYMHVVEILSTTFFIKL